jgi:hypothetical protein
MTMCSEANCQHVRFDPNSKKSLTTEDQASIWADIKETRKTLEARVAFLDALGHDAAMMAADGQMIKLEAMTKSLWTRFRVL